MLHRPTPGRELRLAPFKSLANPFLSVNKQSRAMAEYFYPYKVDVFSVSDPDGDDELEVGFDYDDLDGYSTDSWPDNATRNTFTTLRRYLHVWADDPMVEFVYQVAHSHDLWGRYELHEWIWRTGRYTDEEGGLEEEKELIDRPAWWWAELRRKLQEMGGVYDELDEYMDSYLMSCFQLRDGRPSVPWRRAEDVLFGSQAFI
ncbi:hypothetical protein DL771_010506 [Monosporascus sp. 5C6A]|nr:hypothetical protein DL771_010506 [Monosporascus sp. 5C6A]